MNTAANRYRLTAIGLLVGIAACHRSVVVSSPTASSTTMSPGEVTGDWKPLFDGKTMNGWRGYHTDTIPSGWTDVNGVITKTGAANDIITRNQYANYELQFDWMLPPGGNAGVFYRGTEEYDHIYWSAPEYQLLDDARHPDGRSRLTAAGAAYAVYPSPAGHVKPANQWNHSRIVVNGTHVEHWLNGAKVVDYELASPDWKARVAKSKFSEYPHYGLAPQGYIGIQGDHDGTLRMRNVLIKEISK